MEIASALKKRILTGKENEPESREAAFYFNMVLTGLNTPVCSILLVNKPQFSIGCSPDCDANLHFSKEISRHHACITWENGIYTIKDLNSTNYTFLNGRALTPNQPYAIKDGDQIAFASFIYIISEIRF